MDIIKQIKTLRPDLTEEDLARFLENNKTEISEYILSLWDKDLQTEELPIESSTEPVDETTGNGEITEVSEAIEAGENQAEVLQNDLSATTNQINTEKPTMGRLGERDTKTYEQETFAIQVKGKNISLANGKVGMAYKSSFDIDALGLPEMANYRLEGLEEIGLTFDVENRLIVGTPTTAGDHKIKFFCKRIADEAGSPEVERTITLIINPDPKSLWANKPSDTTDPYYKPDSDSLFLKVKTKRKDVVAASQRGRSHAHEGIFRDDDFALTYEISNEWYILAVADGAGSTKYSRRGSQIACKTVTDVCKHQLAAIGQEFEQTIESFNKDKSEDKRKSLGDKLYAILGSAAFKAQKDIEKEAQEKAALSRDYSTTLLLTIAKKFKFGWFIGSFWVGDGGIGIYNKNNQTVKILGEPDGGEFAGQTRFLTMPEITQAGELYRRLRFEIVDDFTALILMTDGVTDPKFETDANLQKIEKWNALWDDLNNEVTFNEKNTEIDKQLLAWLDYWSPGNHDDRTIAILF